MDADKWVMFRYGKAVILDEDGREDSYTRWYLTEEGVATLDRLDIYHNEYGSFDNNDIGSTIYQLISAGYRVSFEPRTT